MPELPPSFPPGLFGIKTIKPDEVLNLNIDVKIDYPGIRRCYVFVPLVGTFSEYLLLHHMVKEIEDGKAVHTDQIDKDRVGGIWFEFWDDYSSQDLNVNAAAFLRDYINVTCERTGVR